MKIKSNITPILLSIVAILVTACKDDQKKEQIPASESETDMPQAVPADNDAHKNLRQPKTSAEKSYEEFLNSPVPIELKIPYEERGWGHWDKIFHSRKSVYARILMKSDDKKILAKIWREFPSLSETDQFMISLAAYSSNDINQVAAIASLAPSAKSKEIRSQLIRAAKTIIVHALRDPKRNAAAKPIAEQLISSGFAPKLLKNEIKKLEQK